MSNNRYREFFQNLRISQRRLWRLVWPIQWNLFFKPNDVWKAINFASYPFKFSIIIFLLTSILSFFFFYNSLYAISSYSIPAKTGYLEEGLLGLNRSDIANFNPLLTANSDYERRITALLYHPLYRVNLPNFNSNQTDIEIQPVLLSQAPKWIDGENPDVSNRFRRLRMVLRDDIKWSDGKSISIEDVKTTLEKLKDKDANAEFSPNLQEITLEETGQKNTFDLVSPKPAPQLLYNANFSPVPKDIFFSQSISQIAQSASKFPQVTSGFYIFATSPTTLISDPRNPSADKKPNPFIDNRTGVIQSIILERNPYQNITNSVPYIQYYIFQRYPKFKADLSTDPQSASGASDFKNSLEDSFLGNRTSLFFRSTISWIDSDLSSETVKQTLKSEQKTIPTNTYYTLFLKAQNGTYLVNKTLRKYILCNLRESNIYNSLGTISQSNLIAVNKAKMLIPPQLQSSKEVDCGVNTSDIISKMDKKTYTLKSGDLNSGNKIFFGNKQISLVLVSNSQDRIIASKIQDVLRNSGFIVDIIEPDQVEKQGTNSAFLYLYPITTASPDVYNLFSKKAQNIIGSNANTDLNPLEDLLLDYRNSKFSESSRAKLADFLAESMTSMTLFQGKDEFNYSPKVFGMDEALPDFSTMTYDIYNFLPKWYIEKETKSKIFG